MGKQTTINEVNYLLSGHNIIRKDDVCLFTTPLIGVVNNKQTIFSVYGGRSNLLNEVVQL